MRVLPLLRRRDGAGETVRENGGAHRRPLVRGIATATVLFIFLNAPSTAIVIVAEEGGGSGGDIWRGAPG